MEVFGQLRNKVKDMCSHILFHFKDYTDERKKQIIKARMLKQCGILDMIHQKLSETGSVDLEQSPCSTTVGDVYDLVSKLASHQSSVKNCPLSPEEWDRSIASCNDFLEVLPTTIVNNYFTTPRSSPFAPPSRRKLGDLSKARRCLLPDIVEEVNKEKID